MPLFRRLTSGARTPKKARSTRPLRLERLDQRALFAVLPYGAMPDDTGEFMLGDVFVKVVLLESDSSKSTVFGSGDPSTENWTTEEIASVKQKVTDGLDWWKQTLYEQFPQTPPGLLNFDIDFTYADNPFHTGYEPIRRISDDFQYWVGDFLSSVGYASGSNWSSGIRAYNNAQRIAHNDEWAFTMFIVDNSNDLATDSVTPGGFAAGGSFTNAFAYAGGRFLVVPSGRPEMTYAHEVGHMFWALDEYAGAGDYQSSRGYYNTPNTNAANNPTSGFSQQPSIMSNNSAMQAAWDGHTSSETTLALVGWKDSDDDGIMDVLDVPFSLQGDGWYDDSSGAYKFYGKSAVRTLQNRNPSGLQDDITINHIRQAQYQLDGGEWQVIATYDDNSAYSATVDLSIPVEPGNHEIKIRTYDTRTRVTSDEFVGHTSSPSSIGSPGISGYVWYDENHNGTYDTGEQPNVDFGIELVDDQGNVLNLRHTLTPELLANGTAVNPLLNGATVTAIGPDVAGSSVEIMTSSLTGEKVIGTYRLAGGFPVTSYNLTDRNLRIDFDQPTTTLSLRAIGARGTPSYARIDAYNAAGELVARDTSIGLGFQQDETLTVFRAQADIKYVIARTFQTGVVEFADLAWGPLGSGTTDFRGAYSIPFVPPGTYHIRPIVQPYYIPTTFAGGNPQATLGPAGSAEFNFGYVLAPNPWHNSVNPFDVNADGKVSLPDALQVIRWMRRNAGISSLPAEGDGSGNTANYLDVNYDGLATIADALGIIRHMRVAAQQEAGGEAGDANGIAASAAPVGYFNGQPVHFDSLPGDDDDDHDAPLPAAALPVATAPSTPAPAETALSLAFSGLMATPDSPNSPTSAPSTATAAASKMLWSLFASNESANSVKKSAGKGVFDLLADANA